MSDQLTDVLESIDALERDEIDQLVDAQMGQTRSGYDYNINQPRCPHCGDYVHSLPIKQRMQELRSLWHATISYFEDGERVSEEAVTALDAYRYDEDGSPVVCPGSEFVGPIATPWQLERARRQAEHERREAERERQITEYLAGDPSYERLRPAVDSVACLLGHPTDAVTSRQSVSRHVAACLKCAGTQQDRRLLSISSATLPAGAEGEMRWTSTNW